MLVAQQRFELAVITILYVLFASIAPPIPLPPYLSLVVYAAYLFVTVAHQDDNDTNNDE